MIRVLQVVNAMGCGGTENMIMNLYRKIDRTKIQFDFLVHSEKKHFFDEEITELGGNIYIVPYFNGFNLSEYKKALNELFFKHPEIRIVHGHLGSCANIYLKVAKKYGCYTIAHSHSTGPKNITLKNVAYKLLSIHSRYVADFFFGCSDAAGRDRFGKKIFSSNKYKTFNNAIEVSKYQFNQEIRNEIRGKYGISDKFVIGHIGRFCEAKNHSFLIDIFECVSKEVEDSVLMLVGGGSLEAEIRKKIESLNLEKRVIFTGVTPDVNLLLQGMDCFLLPSLYEGLPVTVIEAQASGLPCLLSNTITKEVCVTDLVKSLPIDMGTLEWRNNIIKISKLSGRCDVTNRIKASGYDIATTAQWLMEFYLKKVE